MNHVISSVLLPAVTGATGAKTVVLLYLGPETVMPLASILAALVGILLIGWRYIVNFLKQAFKFIRAKIRHEPVEQAVVVEQAFEGNDEL